MPENMVDSQSQDREGTEDCCGSTDCCSPPAEHGSYVSGTVSTSTGEVPRLNSSWDARDWFGAVLVRTGFMRMDYAVPTGLYAIGAPDEDSPVFVTSNYKSSLDYLRRDLGGYDGWILVLDTDGINVWCAAGEGTFGTDEIVRQVEATRLDEIVSHRRLIVPQLGAPGVSAHGVNEQSGFQVVYGPVRSEDLPQFLDDGLTANEQMRAVRFGLWDRLTLVPVELKGGLKYTLLLAVLMALLAGITGKGYSADVAWSSLPTTFGACLTGLLSGAFLTPALLPWVPGRAFSLKGAVVGGGVGGLMLWVSSRMGASIMTGLGMLLVVMVLSSVYAMNFTGASTYTSLSGVRREMRAAVPVQCIVGLVGVVSWVFV